MSLSKFLSGAVLACMIASAATAQSLSDLAGLFGRSDGVGQPQLSPDGRFLSMECAPAVKLSICVFDLAGGSQPVIVPTLDQTRLTGHYWANNDTLILDVEIFQSVRTSSGMKDYAFQRAIAFDLKDKQPVMLLKQFAGGYLYANDLAAILPAEPGHILIGMFVERAARNVYEAVRVDLKKGTGRAVEAGGVKTVGAVHRPDGAVVAEIFYDRQPDKRHALKVIAGKKTILERSNLDFNPLLIWGLDASGKNLVIFLREPDRTGPFRLSLADGALSPVDLGAFDDTGLVAPVIDRRSLDVVGFRVIDDQTHQIFEDEKLRVQHEELRTVFPDNVVTLVSWTDDRSESVVRVQSPGAPADYYSFDMASGQLSPVGSAAEHLAGRPLGQVQAIRYKAADGLEIPGYLTIPPGKSRADGPFKLILMPHGGPESRDFLAFDWWAQAYAAAGYAVLQPNFRGSSGYGDAFRDAGYGEFGGKMVTDVLDGARWAVAEGLATKSEVCAAGASYGGYSALMLGIIGGNEIRCVISVNGVTNPFALLGDVQPDGFTYNYLTRYLGTGRFASEAVRASITPVKRAGDIKAPVLLIAGKQDMVVPFSQSESFKSAARDRPNVSLVAIDGEDHFISTTVARHKVLDESLQFLARHLPAQ